ncbi:hypothetical protein LPB142_03280 [Rhodobacter xanthinilyticus]|uniref:HTH luxR-type domain-containing protein n=1 Tax=Rhodobacter xanthinilyticus TaxID=1850250 RepID=A0A1D9M9B7_9RHOB|nr:helix-turn-helix transcriptional regulator [Rhodobacter xanthinilyticus]AOZ68456.1 hypothetical protein LPB142_03280 [Rhodobacter xanthinilyticus]
MVELGWRLTPQEARVALEVMHGHTPQQIAGKLGLSINTVRSHLAQACAKTETAGKAELAAALHRSPLGWLVASESTGPGGSAGGARVGARSPRSPPPPPPRRCGGFIQTDEGGAGLSGQAGRTRSAARGPRCRSRPFAAAAFRCCSFCCAPS